MTTPPANALQILNPAICVFRFEKRALHLKINDSKTYYDLELIRMFPLTDPERFLSVLSDGGVELAILKDPREFDLQSQSSISHALNRRYFLPKIVEILSIRENLDTIDWFAITDRGRRHFTTRALRECICHQSGDRLVFADTASNRYELDHYRKLNRYSRSIIERLL